MLEEGLTLLNRAWDRDPERQEYLEVIHRARRWRRKMIPVGAQKRLVVIGFTGSMEAKWSASSTLTVRYIMTLYWSNMI